MRLRRQQHQEQLVKAHLLDLAGVAKHLRRSAGISLLKTVAVRHCKDAWAVVLEHERGWKIAYSGDCRPCWNFARAGRGAHVLIHEATFDESKMEEAVSRKHSTASEAIHVARQMRADRLLLTHFSQRYPKIPGEYGGAANDDGMFDDEEEEEAEEDIDDVKRNDDSNVGIAFDCMAVRFTDLEWLPQLTTPFRWLFPNEEAGEDEHGG